MFFHIVLNQPDLFFNCKHLNVVLVMLHYRTDVTFTKGKKTMIKSMESTKIEQAIKVYILFVIQISVR
jgi:hypothetical protein